MAINNELPSSYIPYERITLCSNELIGVGNIISIGDVIPLLIGKGAAPLVWLQGLSAINPQRFETVVEASVPKNHAIQVVAVGNAIEISVGATIVLRVFSSDANHAIVDCLDLRPLGLNLVGSEKELRVGKMTFSSSTFKAVGTAIALGS